MSEEEIIKKYQRALAKKGGETLRDKKGLGYYSLLGKRSAEVKKENKLKKIKLSTAQLLTKS